MRFLGRFRKAPPSGPELDQVILAQLLGRGADLTRPRHVLHFLYFETEHAAGEAAETVRAAGYDATVVPPDEGTGQWSLRAEGSRVVDFSTVPAFRAFFERVGEANEGEYDGWEAAAEP